MLWIWNRKDEDDSLENWPSVIHDYSQKSDNSHGLQVEEGSDESETGAWLSDWVEFETSLAGVSRDLSISLGEIVESFESAVLFFLSKGSVLRVFERILDDLAFSSLVSDVIHVTFIIGFGANARGVEGLSLVVLSVEALTVLLSPDVGGFVSEEALISRSVSSVVMWAPVLEVRFIRTWLLDTLALWLVKTREIKSDHDIVSELFVGE